MNRIGRFFALFFILFLISGCRAEQKAEPAPLATVDPGWATYESVNFGIRFQYDADDYQAPVENHDMIWLNNTPWIEGTAQAKINFTKITDKDDAFIAAYGEGCELIRENFVPGSASRWVRCAGMGDSDTVLIRHPYRDVILQIDAPFAKESFARLVGSIEFLNTSPGVSWKTYTNDTLGFSMDIPEKVLSDYLNKDSLVPLNVVETNGSVYFTQHSREETKPDQYNWEFKISGTTVKNESEILPWVQSVYNVKGCTAEFNADPDSGFTRVAVYARQEGLMPDDPMACFIGGKAPVLYDKNSGRVITYQLVEPIFYEPAGSVDEQALSSLKFPL